MFGLRAKRQNREVEIEAAMVHSAANVTAREHENKAVVEASEIIQIVRSTCKKRGLALNAQEEEMVVSAVHGIAGSEVIHAMMKRWVQEGAINVSADDIRIAKIELERKVAEFMKTGQR
jgi:hypothetical protein